MTQVPSDPNATPAAPATPPVTPPVPNGGNGEADKKFSQADVEALIKERLSRRDDSERKKLLEKLGIEDEDADAELLKTAKAKREADKTEVERLASEAAKSAKRAEDAETLLAQERAQRVSERRDGMLKDALATLGIKKERASSALKLLTVEQADALTAAIKDGNVDEKAIAKIAEESKKAYPEWYGSGGVGSPSNAGGRVPSPDAATKNKATADLRSAIRKQF